MEKRIQELMQQLETEIKQAFPMFTDAIFCIDPSGHLTMTVSEWEKSDTKPAKELHRRELFHQYRLDGKWSEDTSESTNEYYKKKGILLGGENDERMAG